MFMKSSSYIFNSILAYGYLMKSMLALLLLKIKNNIVFLSVFTGQHSKT